MIRLVLIVVIAVIAVYVAVNRLALFVLPLSWAFPTVLVLFLGCVFFLPYSFFFRLSGLPRSENAPSPTLVRGGSTVVAALAMLGMWGSIYAGVLAPVEGFAVAVLVLLIGYSVFVPLWVQRTPVAHFTGGR